MSSSGEKKKDAVRKPTNSYSMLQMKMSEVQKSKKLQTPSVKKENQSTPKDSKMDSKQSAGKKLPDVDITKQPQPRNPNEPDRSFGDFFCPICDSHMNSDAMWEAHVTGKRHIKNVKKGDTDSKYEDLDGVVSDIKHALRNVKDPIIGLSYIHEIRRREPNVPPMYNCFLCHASIATVPLVIEHVISMKHRMNYIKENASEEHDLLAAINLKKGHLEPLVHDAAVRMERMHGRGEVKVKQEKPKVPFPAYKRKFASDDDEDDWKPPKKNSDLNSDKWKPIGFEKGNYLKMDRSPSPENYRIRKRTAHSEEDYAMSTFRKALELQNRPRERSPREREVLPREREVPPREREVPPRERERSPRERERPPRERERSPRERERSPRERERSPREREWSPRRDDYYKASRNSSRMDDYSRKVEFSRSSSLRDRPEYEPAASYVHAVPNQDKVQRTYSGSNYSNNPQPASSSYMAENSVLPHERPMQNSFDLSNTDKLKDFVENIFALTNDVFLKIILKKLESMKLRNVEEMTLLSNIINKAQQLVCDILPSNIQAVLKQKMDSSNSPARSAPALETPPMPAVRSEIEVRSSNQSLQNLLVEIFRGPNGASSTPSVNQNASATQVFSNVAQSTHVNPQMLSQHSYRNPIQDNQHSKGALSSAPYQAQTTNYNYLAYKNPQAASTATTTINYSYNNTPSNQPSNIPGLTLTEQSNVSNYSGYSRMNYPSAPPSSSQNYSYKY